jgi:hypothetical protein
VLGNHPTAFMIRCFLELLYIYSTSFILKDQWVQLCNEYNSKFTELKKYGIFRILQVDKTVLMALLY